MRVTMYLHCLLCTVILWRGGSTPRWFHRSSPNKKFCRQGSSQVNDIVNNDKFQPGFKSHGKHYPKQRHSWPRAFKIKISRSEESLRWLVNLTSHGLNLTSRKLDLTKSNIFHLRFEQTFPSFLMFNLTPHRLTLALCKIIFFISCGKISKHLQLKNRL